MINNKTFLRNICTSIILIFIVQFSFAQENQSFKFSGKILESGTGSPLNQAVISVVSNNEFTNADENGDFSITLPSPSEKLIISYPGYYIAEFFTQGLTNGTIYLTEIGFRSDNQLYENGFEGQYLKDASNSVSITSADAFENSAAIELDQALQGRVAGLHVVRHSGMPGSNSWVNLRGVSSVYGKNEPMVMIDGMLHEINYPKNQIIEGYIANPFDIVDIDDIVTVSTIKTGEAHLGSSGSNGLINVYTEQNEVTSAQITAKMYGGIVFPFAQQELLDAGQFKSYYRDLINDGYGGSNGDYIWSKLFVSSTDEEYYRYTNNTDWQKEMNKPAAMQKYYIFLKGGDDIATYNISTGYLRHETTYDDWKYSKYNLRLNGRIKITNKLYIVPNTKLSLSDSYLSNMGPTTRYNPVTTSLLKSPLMAPHERSQSDGSTLYPYDDEGDFNVSNPAVLIDKAKAANRNFQFLSSGKIGYDFNKNFSLTEMIGFSFNNDRQNIFIPDIGVINPIWYLKNSPQDMVTEYKSLQNNLNLRYNNTFDNKHYLVANGGIRVMSNIYKNNYIKDLNTATDDYRSAGSGGEYQYLREGGGEMNMLKWVSYYADARYNYHDRYYVNAALSFEGSSVFHKDKRYHFYPSVLGAWRISQEDFLSGMSWIDDLKIRAGYSLTGNMFSSVFKYSELTYSSRRFENGSVPVIDYLANNELAPEKKSTITTGIDLSFGKKAYNVHLDYHLSMVNNLLINQQLPYNAGFTNYYNNGGKLSTSGIELAADGKFNIGNSILVLDFTATYQTSKIKELEFLSDANEGLIHDVPNAQFISAIDNPVNAFYGYETSGIYSSDAEANGIIGPNGREMGAGDVAFVDKDGNNIINEDDKVIIGDPNPDLFGGLNAVLKFGRFELSTLLTYSIGNDVYNYTRYLSTSMQDFSNQSVDVLDRWTPSNTGAELPKATYGDPNGNNVFSDRWMEDGSFLKVKQFSVSYTTPNIYSFKKETTFYITGTNLLTLSKYTGYDPETMYVNSPFSMGVDYGKIPHSLSVIVGIKVNL